MERIGKNNQYGRWNHISARDYKTERESAGTNTVQEADGFGSHDVLELSADWAKQTEEFLDQMKKEYRGVHIIVRESVSGSSVPQLAAGLGTGTWLVVTRDFLERMGSGREDYLACRTVMEETLRRLAGDAGSYAGNGAVLNETTVTSWSVPAADKSIMPVKPPQQTNDYGIPRAGELDFKLSVSTSSGVTASGYARLAGASTKGQVRTVMGEAHRSIASLRMVVALGDDKEKEKARAAIGSLQKMLVRGSRKIKKLDEETLLKIRKNRAEKQRQMKKARRLKQELQKKRSARYSSDSALRTEGLLDEANRKLRFHDEDERRQEIAPFISAGVGVLPGGGAPPIEGGAGFTAADVVVSESV